MPKPTNSAAIVAGFADAILKDVEDALGQRGVYKTLDLSAKINIFLTTAVERLASELGTTWPALKDHVTDFISLGASVYAADHPMDGAKKAAALGLRGVDLKAVDLGGASFVGALEQARALVGDTNRLVLIAHAEAPRGGLSGTAEYVRQNETLCDPQNEALWHPNLIAYYALLARRLMFENDISQADFEAITRHFRRQAIENPRAQSFQNELGDELYKYLATPYSAPMVAVASDHGAAALVCTEKTWAKIARKLALAKTPNATYILPGASVFSGDKYFSTRSDFGSPARLGAALAYQRAGIAPDEVDYAWIYDCFVGMLVRQAADYFGIHPKTAAIDLASGVLRISAPKRRKIRTIPVNRQGGILNTQAALALSAASGLTDIRAWFAALSGKKRKIALLGANGGLDSINAVIFLSNKPGRARETKNGPKLNKNKFNDIQDSGQSRASLSANVSFNDARKVAGRRATLFSHTLVRFHPGKPTPYHLAVLRDDSGRLTMAHLVDANGARVANSDALAIDRTRVEFREFEGRLQAMVIAEGQS